MIQGTQEWREERRGRITASRFRDVMVQPKTNAAKDRGDLSKTAATYLLDIIAEILTGQIQEPPVLPPMQWGIDNEAAAADVYEDLTGNSADEVGFIQIPNEPIGGSPDRLIGSDGGLEIKCPYNTRIHLGYVMGGVLPKDHVAQVQGLMWITGRKWWDFVTYDPRVADLKLAFWRLRVQRDEAYIERLEKAVYNFRDKMLETLCQLKERTL